MKQALEPRRYFENPAYKDKVTVLKSNQETGGSYSLGKLEVAPGGGNSLHIHKAFAETFTAVKGILGVQLRNRKLYLRPGESVTVPAGTPHHFFNNTSETIVCNVKFEPGHGGFEKGLAIAYGLAAEGKTNAKGVPKNITHLALIMVLTDTRPAGAMGLLMPLFRLLAARAIKKGVEQELLKKYYYQ